MIYRVGQIWQRDGKRREIVAIRTGEFVYHRSTDGIERYRISWVHDCFGSRMWCWGRDFSRWARGAELVEVRK